MVHGLQDDGHHCSSKDDGRDLSFLHRGRTYGCDNRPEDCIPLLAILANEQHCCWSVLTWLWVTEWRAVNVQAQQDNSEQIILE